MSSDTITAQLYALKEKHHLIRGALQIFQSNFTPEKSFQDDFSKDVTIETFSFEKENILAAAYSKKPNKASPAVTFHIEVVWPTENAGIDIDAYQLLDLTLKNPKQSFSKKGDKVHYDAWKKRHQFPEVI